MVQSEVSSQATIKSLAIELDIMIIEWLPLKDALNLAKSLLIQEQVALQYFAFEEDDLVDIYHENFSDIQPSSFKFLLKNTSFQIKGDSYGKTWVAVRTLDLDFVKKCIEQAQPHLIDALKQQLGLV